MRIVSWNICAGGGKRAERIARQIERWRPSVVVLCEFRGTPPSQSLALRLSRMGLAHQRSTVAAEELSRNSLLVASRWPLRYLAVGGGPNEPGRWLSVRVDAPEPLVLGALHVPNQVTGRKYTFHDAVVSVAARWTQRPAMLVGDTNTGWPLLDEEVPCFGPRDEAFLRSLDALGWADAFRLVRGRGRAYSWYSPNGRNGFRIDQAFLTPGLVSRLRSASYVWGDGRAAGLSDHAALVVDLSESAAPPPGLGGGS